MNIPPWRGRDRLRWAPTDEEIASTPHVLLPQGEPQVPLEFQVPPMLQPDLFPIMTLKAFQTYTNFWYAQAQVQTPAGHGQFPMPPIASSGPPLAQPAIKFSKLVKGTRQLRCETFSSTIVQLQQRTS